MSSNYNIVTNFFLISLIIFSAAIANLSSNLIQLAYSQGHEEQDGDITVDDDGEDSSKSDDDEEQDGDITVDDDGEDSSKSDDDEEQDGDITVDDDGEDSSKSDDVENDINQIFGIDNKDIDEQQDDKYFSIGHEEQDGDITVDDDGEDSSKSDDEENDINQLFSLDSNSAGDASLDIIGNSAADDENNKQMEDETKKEKKCPEGKVCILGPTLTDDPPTLTDDPPTLTDDPPTLTDDPPILTDDPPTLTDDPPTLTDDPPTLTDDPPTLTDDPPKKNKLQCPEGKVCIVPPPPPIPPPKTDCSDNGADNKTESECNSKNIKKSDKSVHKKDTRTVTHESLFSDNDSCKGQSFADYHVTNLKVNNDIVSSNNIKINLEESSIFGERIKGTLTIKKFSSDTGKPFPNTLFKITPYPFYSDFDQDFLIVCDNEVPFDSNPNIGTISLLGVKFTNYVIQEIPPINSKSTYDKFILHQAEISIHDRLPDPVINFIESKFRNIPMHEDKFQIIPNQYIIILRPNINQDPQSIANEFAKRGAEILYIYDTTLKGVAINVHDQTLLQQIKNDSRVSFVEQDKMGHITSIDMDINDNLETVPTGMDRIDADT